MNNVYIVLSDYPSELKAARKYEKIIVQRKLVYGNVFIGFQQTVFGVVQIN